ncbi:hypothetical protein DMN91_008076 [Ooceraea biroi]|uniref:Uncharacterized protein n=1 Tax=Ooceraea biroi TaxID=2015173 RepID=A0A3L8DHX2_OOCBI|nr:uncharacterized protein LOC105275465 [Ooceraea biroi]XP_011330613.1 uncharacterized protein LOC105275465 [Ooceraea biroi]XP_019885954.1 uncharacterized protein LOC105275465 [Ooceraea biroi]RLU19519.1 hypothetical protein DMN91_008076 [Ooceraea biroi]
MNKRVLNKQINKPLHSNAILHSKSNGPSKATKVSQSPFSTKVDNASNVIDYKSIPLSMRGEISSGLIHRNSLKQKKHDISSVETMEDEEDDDEEFFSNLKKKIDQNRKLQNNESYNITNLQSKSYLAKKRRGAFSEEDENLIKRFKRSVNESKAVCVTPQKMQPQSVASNDETVTTNTPQITLAVSPNNIDTNFGSDTNQNVTSMTERSNPLMTTEAVTSFVQTVVEIEQSVHFEMQRFTPPEGIFN